jgi:hypothetical protein
MRLDGLKSDCIKLEGMFICDRCFRLINDVRMWVLVGNEYKDTCAKCQSVMIYHHGGKWHDYDFSAHKPFKFEIGDIVGVSNNLPNNRRYKNATMPNLSDMEGRIVARYYPEEIWEPCYIIDFDAIIRLLEPYSETRVFDISLRNEDLFLIKRPRRKAGKKGK